MRLLGLKARGEDLKDWRRLVSRINGAKREVRIGIVGKYFASGSFTLADSYISVIEAVKHAVWSAGGKPIIEWLNAEQYEKDPKSVRELAKYDGVIVPGGFGSRGIEGKIAAIRWCREHRKPFFGLCYGMQLAVVEFARHVAGMKRANTTEIDPETPQPVIHIMPEQERLVKQKKFGATMRLGAWPCHLADGTLCRRAYGRAEISERHRHRYEFNNAYRERLRQAGLVIAGTSPDGLLVEAVEIKKHPFFVGTQFHPEFLSRPLSPHPLFRAFAKAAMRKA